MREVQAAPSKNPTLQELHRFRDEPGCNPRAYLHWHGNRVRLENSEEKDNARDHR
jgi:hypothetical protein